MIDITAMVVMLEELQKGRGATVAQLVEATGLHKVTVRNWLRPMHNRPRPVIYILDWKCDGNKREPIWAMGYCVADAPRPAPKSDTVKAREYRQRKRIASGVLDSERGAATYLKRAANARAKLGPDGKFIKKESLNVQHPNQQP